MQHTDILGFTDQGERNKALVNRNKEIEERVMRILDELGQMPGVDPRMLAIGHTGIQDAFMWINRAIFQPQRIALPEDEQVEPPAPSLPPVHIGDVFRSEDPQTGEEIIRDAKGNDLVAYGPNWYRKKEFDQYTVDMQNYSAERNAANRNPG